MSNGYGRSTDGFGINRQQSVELIVKTALENGVSDPRQIAYMLATAQHETRNFTAPDEDFGRQQAKKLKYDGGEEYFGRGYVHLTHRENYRKFDKLLGMNGELVKNPELAKQPEIAAKILVIGMRDGLFTGKKLERYVDEDSHDLYNARRVVNGVSPAQAWSITAAKDCQRYAQTWEQQIDGVINRVKNNGVDLSNRTVPNPEPPTTSRPAANALADGVLRQNERGADVQGLQASLNRLQMTDAAGQPLREDGNFGQRTREAVERFQRENGLKVDGIAGPRTLEAIGQRLPPGTVTVERAEVTGLADGRNPQTQAPQPQAQTPQAPLITDAAHPNNALYAAIARQLPPGTRPEAIANVTLQAMENGMTDPSKLGKVGMNNNDAFVMPAGSFGGNWVRVDLTAPTASLKVMSDHMAGETREAMQQQQQRLNTQTMQTPEQNRPGPVMV